MVRDVRREWNGGMEKEREVGREERETTSQRDLEWSKN